jgi:phospholipase C
MIFNLAFTHHCLPSTIIRTPALGCDLRFREPLAADLLLLEGLVKMNRRELVKNLALASGAVAFGASWPFSSTTSARVVLPDLPNPGSSGIDHVVVVTMENRSFDHFFGWLPNADGKQAGLTYVDNQGVAHHTYSLSGDNTGCPHPDPDHSYDQGRVEYDGGKMDGFLRAGSNDIYSIG